MAPAARQWRHWRHPTGRYGADGGADVFGDGQGSLVGGAAVTAAQLVGPLFFRIVSGYRGQAVSPRPLAADFLRCAQRLVAP